MTPMPTYDTFGLHQIVAVQGWQGVWWMSGRHEVLPLHLLALVTRTTWLCTPGAKEEVMPWPAHTTAAEKREVVGLELTERGVQVCDETINYCGLLAPGMTLADFEAWGTCRHGEASAPATQGSEAGTLGAD